MASSSSTLACASCHDPLVMTVDSDSDSDAGHQPGPSSSSAPAAPAAPEVVPDDLHLPCGCHFHWQCLLDLSAQVASTLSCPNCSSPLSSPGQPGLQALYSSEGGQSEPVDLLLILQEEAHLASHPEERPARALHTMVSEGDVEGVVELVLRDAEERSALLGYRDPLAGGRNALHVAVEHGKPDAVWLLLWAGSGLPSDNFSLEMRQTMGAIGLDRAGGGEDLRFVRDAEGRTPGDYAAASGQWDDLINGGAFMSTS